MTGAAFACVFTDDACLAGLARVRGAAIVALEDAGQAPDGAGPLLLAPHALLEPLLERDPSRWLAALEATATAVLALAQRLAAMRGGALELVLCGEQSIAQTVIRPSDRWRFWRDRRPADSLGEAASASHD